MTWSVEQADCIEWLRSQPADSADLIFGSPPYEQARLYLEDGRDLGVARDTEAWVAWMVEVYRECLRVCKGLTAFVVEGQTRKYRYSCGPFLLMADLCRAGFNLRKPPVYHRVGIPGSGGPDWWRNDYEPIVCVSRPGKLPWSDNTAMGHTPKWAPGGEMSHRMTNGTRRNEWGKSPGQVKSGTRCRTRSGIREKPRRRKDGDAIPLGDAERQGYNPPKIANPGNIIRCKVGGGFMGNDMASENEAPFPELLAQWFVLSFCPPGGVVLDPFSGSGTTGAVCVRHGRHFKGCDLRQSQVELASRRIGGETPTSLFGE